MNLSTRLGSLSRRLHQRYHESWRIVLLSRRVGLKAALLQEAKGPASSLIAAIHAPPPPPPPNASSTNATDNVHDISQTHRPHVNQTAISLLRAEQQWSLMKYHGLSDYARMVWANRQANGILNRLAFSSSSSSSSNSDMTTSAAAPNASSSSFAANRPTSSSSAKIAVMITNRMRHELVNELGYDDKRQISKLTPLQASLILLHRLPAPPLPLAAMVPSGSNDNATVDARVDVVDDKEQAVFQERLAALEQEYHDGQERERQAQLAAQEEAEALEAAAAASSKGDSAVADKKQSGVEILQESSIATDDVSATSPSQPQQPAAAATSSKETRLSSPFAFLTASASKNLLAKTKTEAKEGAPPNSANTIFTSTTSDKSDIVAQTEPTK